MECHSNPHRATVLQDAGYGADREEATNATGPTPLAIFIATHRQPASLAPAPAAAAAHTHTLTHSLSHAQGAPPLLYIDIAVVEGR